MIPRYTYILIGIGLIALLLTAGCAERASTGGLENVFGKGPASTTTPTPPPTTEPYPDVTVRISGPGSGLIPAENATPVVTTAPVLKDVYKGIFNLSYLTYTHVALDYMLERPPLIITATFIPKEMKRTIVTTSSYGKKEEITITTGYVTADTRAIITVKDSKTGETIFQDGYRGLYSSESRKIFRIMKTGMLTIEIDGLNVEVDLQMQVYE